MTGADLINHPPHYQGNRFESIEIIEAYRLGFHLGNSWKYLCRHSKKDGRVGLDKARWYFVRLLTIEEAWEDQVWLWKRPIRTLAPSSEIARDFGLKNAELNRVAACILDAGLAAQANEIKPWDLIGEGASILDAYLAKQPA
jgi:hypothetical protein